MENSLLRSTATIFFLFSFFTTYSQVPGGVNNGNELWLKANSGVTLTGGAISLWSDQFNSNDVSQGTAISRPILNSNDANYNPSVVFDGTNDYLRHQLAAPFTDEFTIFFVAKVPTGQTGAKSLFNNWHSGVVGDNDGTSFQVDVGTGGGANFRFNSWGDVVSSPNTGNYQIITLSSNANNPPQIDNNHNGLLTNTGNLTGNDFSQTFRDYELGTNRVESAFLNSFTSETILYRNILSMLDHKFVESYLAIKYSVTLDNTGGGTAGDYISTTGNTIWDASVSPSYHNNVIGIGREDIEALNQKQSHTFDDTTRIYLNTLAATNAANTGTFNDFSYIMMGDNQGAMKATAAATAEVPPACGLFSRLEREWKVRRRSTGKNFSIDVSLSAGANPTLVNVSHLRLLVDNDGDFSNGGTTCYFNGDGTGVVITYNNPTITISGISTTHIPNNSTRYITIASINSATPLPVELTQFDVECNNTIPVLTWATASEINNDYFTIERSTDAINFTHIATVSGNGNSNTTNHYTWSDDNSINGTAYYRLKQTDFDGAFEYHGVKTVLCEQASNISIYPNPFASSFTVELSANNTYPTTIEISDYLGRIVHTQKVENATSEIVLADKIAKGIYFVKVFNETTQIVERIIKTN